MNVRFEPKPRQIAEKSFAEEDQRVFARASLDCNPMHMDPIAARRLLTGGAVVHGMHLLLTAIERWQRDDRRSPMSISCTFDTPANVGDNVVFTQTDAAACNSGIEAWVNGISCARMTLTTLLQNPESTSAAGATEFEPCEHSRRVDNLCAPLDEAPESHLGKTYTLRLDPEACSTLFPRSCRILGKNAVAAVSALSYFVGMVCPGLHSLFSSLSFSIDRERAAQDSLTFKVLRYHDRARLFDIAFEGCIRGTLRAFLRPAPQKQPTMSDLTRFVSHDEFRGTRSLIIGGSRGLGELTAKLLAAGGGDVIISYALGADDASKVCDEINGVRAGACQALKLDVVKDSFCSTNVDFGSIDTVYFFATPRIFRKTAGPYDSRLFQEFIQFYVETFYRLCTYLEADTARKKTKVFLPSSIAVAERVKGMTEYAMAKAAAEILSEDINKRYENVSVLCARLPRLSTDQTSSLLRVAAESNVESILPIIRALAKPDEQKKEADQ